MTAEMGDDSGMEWDQDLIERLDTALNEARVCDLAYRAAERELDLFIEVLSLPDEGPMDQDPRRVLKLAEVSSVEVVLRHDRPGEDIAQSPVVPLRSLDEVRTLLAALAWAHSMYGWEFVDTEHFRDQWPAMPSVTAGIGSPRAAHSLFWFTECGDEGASYCLEGVAYFGTLGIERADGTRLSLADFANAGVRWWQAFQQRDPRVGGEAQQAAGQGGLSWRGNGLDGVVVPGRE